LLRSQAWLSVRTTSRWRRDGQASNCADYAARHTASMLRPSFSGSSALFGNLICGFRKRRQQGRQRNHGKSVQLRRTPYTIARQLRWTLGGVLPVAVGGGAIAARTFFSALYVFHGFACRPSVPDRCDIYRAQEATCCRVKLTLAGMRRWCSTFARILSGSSRGAKRVSPDFGNPRSRVSVILDRARHKCVVE
jgi:hypothetical protein